MTWNMVNVKEQLPDIKVREGDSRMNEITYCFKLWLERIPRGAKWINLCVNLYGQYPSESISLMALLALAED